MLTRDRCIFLKVTLAESCAGCRDTCLGSVEARRLMNKCCGTQQELLQYAPPPNPYKEFTAKDNEGCFFFAKGFIICSFSKWANAAFS